MLFRSDIENLWGTNSENDDINDCHAISTIHVSSNDDMKSSKLGDDVFENPFAIADCMLDISPSIKNNDMFTNEHSLEDDYSIAYDDTMPPVFDNYYNHPYETCHSYGGIAQNHPFNIQLVYHVQVLYDDPAPIVINEKNSFYVENSDTFMHAAQDKNVLCDSYIVDFIDDATESYYERGKHGYMHLNNIKFPLFMLKFLKFHSFCLPMLATLCFVDLFFYKIILHRKWVRLKFVLHLLLDALFSSIHTR